MIHDSHAVLRLCRHFGVFRPPPSLPAGTPKGGSGRRRRRFRHRNNPPSLATSFSSLSLANFVNCIPTSRPELDPPTPRPPPHSRSTIHLPQIATLPSQNTRMALSRFAGAGSRSLRAAASAVASSSSRSVLRAGSASSIASSSGSSSFSTLSPACCSCSASTSSLAPLPSRHYAQARCYATASPSTRMATVVDGGVKTAATGGNSNPLENVQPYKPDPLVLSPVKEGAVDEAVEALREDIGRPIYLDMQVRYQGPAQSGGRQFHIDSRLYWSSCPGPATPGGLTVLTITLFRAYVPLPARQRRPSIQEFSTLCYRT